MQGGDFTSAGRGDGQMSVFGPRFEDENFLVKHDSLGIILKYISYSYVRKVKMKHHIFIS